MEKIASFSLPFIGFTDVATSLTTQDGVSVLFRSAGGLGSIQVEGFVEQVAAVDVARVEDAALVEQHGHVFLVAAVTQSLTTGDTHHVEVREEA